MKTSEIIELICLNIFGLASSGWLASLLNSWSTIMAIAVAISIITLNFVKVRAAIKQAKLDSELKDLEIELRKKELEEKN